MDIKKWYYYLFYKLYKFWEFISSPRVWSDAKAVLTLSVLELFIIYSLIIYYRLLINKDSDFGEGVIPIFLSILFIATPNFYIFIYGDKWKAIIVEFDKWSEEEHKRGSRIVWSVIILVILNLIIACNLPY